MLVSTEGLCEHSKVESAIYTKVREDCRQVVQLLWKKKNLSSPLPFPTLFSPASPGKMIIRNLTWSCIKEAVSLFASEESSSTIWCEYSVFMNPKHKSLPSYCCREGREEAAFRQESKSSSISKVREIRPGFYLSLFFRSFCFSIHSQHFFSWYVPCLPNPGYPEISQLTTQAH